MAVQCNCHNMISFDQQDSSHSSWEIKKKKETFFPVIYNLYYYYIRECSI